MRHPQYAGFIAIMVGFLLQWPTLPTLVMFPILVVVHRRLAIREERDFAAASGPEWDAYASDTPRFIPTFRRTHDTSSPDPSRGSARTSHAHRKPNLEHRHVRDTDGTPTERAEPAQES